MDYLIQMQLQLVAKANLLHCGSLGALIVGPKSSARLLVQMPTILVEPIATALIPRVIFAQNIFVGKLGFPTVLVDYLYAHFKLVLFLFC